MSSSETTGSAWPSVKPTTNGSVTAICWRSVTSAGSPAVNGTSKRSSGGLRKIAAKSVESGSTRPSNTTRAVDGEHELADAPQRQHVLAGALGRES